jgi:hypothetical protein
MKFDRSFHRSSEWSPIEAKLASFFSVIVCVSFSHLHRSTKKKMNAKVSRLQNYNQRWCSGHLSQEEETEDANSCRNAQAVGRALLQRAERFRAVEGAYGGTSHREPIGLMTCNERGSATSPGMIPVLLHALPRARLYFCFAREIWSALCLGVAFWECLISFGWSAKFPTYVLLNLAARWTVCFSLTALCSSRRWSNLVFSIVRG